MAFKRTDKYIEKLTMEALDKDVRLDAVIDIVYLGKKLKAYCGDTGTYIQFPRDLRRTGDRYYADIIKAGSGDGIERTVFYRAVQGSIRNNKSGNPIA